MSNFGLLGCVLCLLLALGGSNAFDISHSNNLIAFWSGSLQEDRLSAYCDGSVDAIVIDGLIYRQGGLPMSGSYCGNTTFPGSDLAKCPDLEADILECQKKAVAILIHVLGSENNPDDWSYSQESARAYANLLWNLVLGGSSSTRPFGQVPLDGAVIDIAYSQSIPGLTALVDRLAGLSEEDGKRYFWTVSFGCSFTDVFGGAEMITMDLNAILVAVSYSGCSVAHYDDKTAWNYGFWDDWVSRQSPRSDFKIYLEVDSSDTAIDSDYASPSRLAQIASGTITQYPRFFGGIAYFYASPPVSNDSFNVQLRKALSTLALPPTSSPTSTSISSFSFSTGISSGPVTRQNPSRSAESHSSHTKVIVGITVPVLVIACATVTALVYLLRRRRRARRGDEEFRDSTGELIAPYPPPQSHMPDPWVPPVKWVEQKSNSSPPEVPGDTPAEAVQPANAVHAQPPILQNPEGLAALETEIGRVGLTVPALLASLGRLRTPPSAMSFDSVSETVTAPPEYS